MSKYISLQVPLVDGRVPTDVNTAINIDLLGSGIYSKAASVDSSDHDYALVYSEIELEGDIVGDVAKLAQEFLDAAHSIRMKKIGRRVVPRVTTPEPVVEVKVAASSPKVVPTKPADKVVTKSEPPVQE